MVCVRPTGHSGVHRYERDPFRAALAAPTTEGLDNTDETHLARAATHLLDHVENRHPDFYCEDASNVRHFAARVLGRLTEPES